MNEGRAPAPDFDSSRYERPNATWVCGNARDGCPCRIGPSPSGQCRATTECEPRLVLKQGETKGTWVCTRPGEWGGKCKAGPLPDGKCCNEIPRCRPVRSLRGRRGILTCSAVALSAAVLLLGLSGSNRDAFVNPRPLSRSHSGVEFSHLAAGTGGGQGCVLCHVDAHTNLADLVVVALQTSHGSLRLAALTSNHPKDLSRIDHSCLGCHQDKAFHQLDVARETSCSVCHKEHQGAGPMASVDTTACTACHGDAKQMLASRELSRPLPAILFAKKDISGLVHTVPRPPEGYTDVITSFSVDHPEFRVLRERSRDQNTLRFNHRLHLGGQNIPLIDGHPLDCAYCHKPDASKSFMARVTFEASCRACHALGFDDHNPAMTLPHGDVAFVRAYLRSLPAQYAEYGTRTLGIPASEIGAFVRRQVQSLREREHDGEQLERSVFLSDGRVGPSTAVAGAGGAARTPFTGCALCHEVVWAVGQGPRVTPPRTPDRWLPLASFSHAAHATTACSACHAAGASELTSDVILPGQQTCARCHSPKGGAQDSCTSCHVYHNKRPSMSAKEPLAFLP